MQEDEMMGRWTKAEHKKFLEAIEIYGRDWRLFKEHIGTRSCVQIRSHAQKHFLKHKVSHKMRSINSSPENPENSGQKSDPADTLNKQLLGLSQQRENLCCAFLKG
jgi:SHAQKYF class myb-like DNA-binding protein